VIIYNDTLPLLTADFQLKPTRVASALMEGMVVGYLFERRFL